VGYNWVKETELCVEGSHEMLSAHWGGEGFNATGVLIIKEIEQWRINAGPRMLSSA